MVLTKQSWVRDITNDVTRVAKSNDNSSGIRRNTSDISTGCGPPTTTSASSKKSFEREQTTGASAYVSQDVIRRLATARRRKNWRAALAQLEEIEREAVEVRNARMRTRRKRGGKAGRQQQQQWDESEGEYWRVWCVSGACSKEDVKRARTTVYNMVMAVLGTRKR